MTGHAHSFRLGAVAPIAGLDRALLDMRAAHAYYNELVAIERWRRAETSRHWAAVGGYTAELERVRALGEEARALPKGPERKAAFQEADAAQRELYALERKTVLEHAATPEERRRKERAVELRAEAKARGQKLSAVDLAKLLDQEPDCVAPRDRLRKEIAVEYEALGKRVSGRIVNARLRAAGLVRPTDVIDNEAKARDYSAYEKSQISYYTRAIVSERFEKSLEDSRPDPPKFQSWANEGVLGVSYVRSDNVTFATLLGGENLWCKIRPYAREKKPRAPGLSWADLLARGWTRNQIITHASRRHDRYLARIERLEEQLGIQPCFERTKGVPHGREEGSRRTNKHMLLDVRIGTVDRKPVWLSVPVHVPENIPLDARISTVRVYVRRHGLHDVWHAVLCTELDQPVRSVAPAASGKVVAIDSCWRRLPDGNVRVAYCVDDQGEEWGINVPETTLSRFARAEELDAVLGNLWLRAVDREDGERTHAGVIADLSTWLDTCGLELPDWLAEVRPYVARWRSAPRFHDFVLTWKERRFPGDEEIYSLLSAWRERWRHLYGWSADLRASAIAARRAHYQKAAHEIAMKYETVLVRGFDMSSLKRRKSAESTDKLVLIDDAVRSVQTKAASGELRECIQRAAQRKSRMLLPVEAEGLTTMCHACGETCEWDRATELHHECEHCGAVWDQHANITHNMLEWFGDEQTPEGARNSPKPLKSKGKGEGLLLDPPAQRPEGYSI